MLTKNRIMAFIPSANLERSRAFYERTLGMKVLYQDNFAVALVSRGTMIRVTQVGEFTPQRFTIFGWEVPNIERAVQNLKKKGIAFHHYGMPGQDDFGIWTAPGGARIAWFPDPDGNNLSFTQFATASRKPRKPAPLAKSKSTNKRN